MKVNFGHLAWRFVPLQPSVCAPLVVPQNPLLVRGDNPAEERVFIGSTEQRCADGSSLDFVSLRQFVWNPSVQLSHHSHRMEVVSNGGSVTPNFACQLCCGLMKVCLERGSQRGVIDAGGATRTWLILKTTISSRELCKPFISGGCA